MYNDEVLRWHGFKGEVLDLGIGRKESKKKIGYEKQILFFESNFRFCENVNSFLTPLNYKIRTPILLLV